MSAGDALLAFGDTARDVTHHLRLTMLVLAGVAMRAVDDQPMCRSGIGRHFGADGVHGLGHRSGIVIRPCEEPRNTTWQSGLPSVLTTAARPRWSMPKNVCCCAEAKQESAGALMEPSVAFLKPIGMDRPGRQLPVHLAFRIARADRTPANRVGNILRTGRLQKLRGRRQTLVKHAKQRAAGQQQALPDIAAAVDIRMVHATLPTDRGARLLEIHAHDDQQLAIQLAFQRGQATP